VGIRPVVPLDGALETTVSEREARMADRPADLPAEVLHRVGDVPVIPFGGALLE
jgi:hypothetical protein